MAEETEEKKGGLREAIKELKGGFMSAKMMGEFERLKQAWVVVHDTLNKDHKIIAASLKELVEEQKRTNETLDRFVFDTNEKLDKLLEDK